MKNNLLVFAFLLMSLACFSQSDEVSYGFEVYTNMVDAIIKNDIFDDLEEQKLAASTSFFVKYPLRPKLAFVGGVAFMNKGSQWKINYDDLRWGNQFDGEGGYDIYTDPMESPFSGSRVIKYNDYYLGVPLSLQYAFGESLNKGWYLQGGFVPMFYWLSRDKSVLKSDGEKDEVIINHVKEEVRKVNLNLQLGFGYNFMLNEKFQISVGPSIEFMPIDGIKNSRAERRYYSYGFSTSFTVL